MTFRAILLLNLWFARDMPLLAERGWWEGRRKEVEEKIGKEERNVRGGGSQSPGEPGQALIFSLDSSLKVSQEGPFPWAIIMLHSSTTPVLSISGKEGGPDGWMDGWGEERISLSNLRSTIYRIIWWISSHLSGGTKTIANFAFHYEAPIKTPINPPKLRLGYTLKRYPDQIKQFTNRQMLFGRLYTYRHQNQVFIS